MRLLPPMRFRFTDPNDVAAYGDRWWVWDEADISRLKGRELIALEETVGPVMAVLRGFATESTFATMAAMWLAMHRDGHPVVWADFNPVVILADWQDVPEPATPLDFGEDPEPASDSSTAVPESTESPTS